METAAETLKKKLDGLPSKPGVYLMKDKSAKVIYVGKAVKLKNRVRSYFRTSGHRDPKTEMLVSKVYDFDYIVTATEVEALLLENNLIKEHMPKYNILLKDDKTYPYIKVSLADPFPMFTVTRKRQADGSRYYGPFAAASAMHEVMRLIKHMFPLRSCELDIRPGGAPRRPCLNYQMGRCTAPCAGFITQPEYRAVVDQAMLLLEGRVDRLVRELTADMKKASEEMLFEKAAIIRDRIRSVELVGAMQKIVMEPGDDADAIGIAGALSDVCVAVITVRDGRVVGKAHFFLEGASEGAKGEALSAFIKQSYASSSAAPPSIALPEQPEGAKELEDWLSSREGRKVRIAVPKRGVRRDIVLMAEENAEEMLRLRLAEEERMRARTQGAVQALADAIALPAPPYRIECFDISNIQGTDTVASMVVFEDGLPARKEYRRFRIRSVDGPDDFASMAEAVGRRFRKAKEEDPKFSRLPGLLLIDGGKGQLAAALEAMRKEGFDLPAAGLAKREEEIFLPDRQDPVLLGRDDYALHLLQRVRDEAHRFAVTYHRSIRGKKSIKSELSELPGIGRARLVALMKAFGSLAGLAKADVEAIRAVKGMDTRSAKAVWSHLHEGKEVAAYDGGDGEEKG